MTQLPEDEKEWLAFLRENHPTPPPAANDLEEQLMKAIATSGQQVQNRRMWIVTSAIAAGLLMTWSSHYFLNISHNSPNYASLEIFLEHNWNEVVGEVPANSQSNNSQEDWILEENTAP